jgi:hypothetical protein
VNADHLIKLVVYGIILKTHQQQGMDVWSGFNRLRKVPVTIFRRHNRHRMSLPAQHISDFQKNYSTELNSFGLSSLGINAVAKTHHHHHWLDSPTWALAFLRNVCQLKYPAIASSDFATRAFSRVGLSAPLPVVETNAETITVHVHKSKCRKQKLRNNECLPHMRTKAAMFKVRNCVIYD